MDESLRLPVKVYIAALVVATIAISGVNLQAFSGLNTEQFVLTGALTGLMMIALLYPLHFAYKTKLTLDTAVIFTAILLLPAVVAMLIAALGTLLAYVIRFRDTEPAEIVFNVAQTALQAGIGGLLLAAVGWNITDLRFDQPAQVVMIIMAAIAMYLFNTLAVAIAIGLQTGLRSLLVWRQSISYDDVEHLAQLAIGLLAAIVIDAHTWALPLVFLPAGVVYLSLARHVEVRTQTNRSVESLADIVDVRDQYTADHSRRVAIYAREIATALGLTPDNVDLIERAARVHDVGKIAIDSTMLSKPGRLTEEEWAQFRRHPATGAEILGHFPQFELATKFVRHHHERIDGAGYPDGLSGDQIPLGARVIAVADALDAMTSARPYRAALSVDEALEEFVRHRGRQWDAQVVDTLVALVEEGRLPLLTLERPETASGTLQRVPIGGVLGTPNRPAANN